MRREDATARIPPAAGDALWFRGERTFLRLDCTMPRCVGFLYLLFARGLILDGGPGWYYVMQRTLAEMLLSLRLLTEREGLERKD